MENVIKIKYLYLDTEVFIQNNFQFSKGALNQILELVSNKKIKFLITQITINEIKANIKKNVTIANSAMKKLQKDGRILRNIKTNLLSTNIFSFNKNNIENDLINQLEIFLSNVEAEIINTTNVNSDTIFSNYFSTIAPFGTGNKKEEFPDAFVIEGIKCWCKDTGNKIFIVSGDGDWENACVNDSTIKYFSKIQEFLEVMTSEEEISKYAETIYNYNIEKIIEAIKRNFSRSGFYLSYCDGDIDNIEVNDVILIEKYLVHISDNKMMFDIQFEIDYDAYISWNNYAESPYDTEDKEYLFIKTEDTDVRIEEIINASVTIEFDIKNIKESEIVELVINSNDDIEISFDPNTDL